MESEKRKTPIMGWASWNCFRTKITEELLREQVDALVEKGLNQHGYIYFNIDDGFFGGRDEKGNLLTHSERFPDGMAGICQYAHQKGLKAGIYSDAGKNSCGFYWDNEGSNGENVGLYGYEEQDLNLFLKEWDFDFIKVDWCGGLNMKLDEQTQYTKIGKIIEGIRQETGKEIIFNICRWEFPGEWAVDVADSWRTGSDIGPEFQSVMYQIDMAKPLREYCGPGHVNDLDMLQVGNGMTDTEDRTHFSMWCMMSTPLMIGCDLRTIRKESLEILTNDEMIAVHQDEGCRQAYVVQCNKKDEKIETEVWVKDLGVEPVTEKAVAFLNRTEERKTISIKLDEIGFRDKTMIVRDLWNHYDFAVQEEISVEVEPHGCEVFRIKQ